MDWLSWLFFPQTTSSPTCLHLINCCDLRITVGKERWLQNEKMKCCDKQWTTCAGSESGTISFVFPLLLHHRTWNTRFHQSEQKGRHKFVRGCVQNWKQTWDDVDVSKNSGEKTVLQSFVLLYSSVSLVWTQYCVRILTIDRKHWGETEGRTVWQILKIVLTQKLEHIIQKLCVKNSHSSSITLSTLLFLDIAFFLFPSCLQKIQGFLLKRLVSQQQHKGLGWNRFDSLRWGGNICRAGKEAIFDMIASLDPLFVRHFLLRGYSFWGFFFQLLKVWSHQKQRSTGHFWL